MVLGSIEEDEERQRARAAEGEVDGRFLSSLWRLAIGVAVVVHLGMDLSLRMFPWWV